MNVIQAHGINAWVVGISGALFNLFLLYIIRTKSPKELQTYTPMLRINSIVDIMFSTTTLVAQPYVTVISGRLVSMVTGPGQYLGWHICWMLCGLYNALYLVAASALPLTFIVMYLMVARGVKMTPRLYLYPIAAMIAVGGARLSTYVITLITTPYDTSLSPLVEPFMHFKQPSGVYNYIYAYLIPGQNAIFSALTNYALLHVTVFFVTALVMASRIYRFFAKQTSSMSKQTRILFKQLVFSLLVQTTAPFTITIFPTILNILSTELIPMSIEARLMISFIFFILISWSPVYNPMATLLLVRPYRVAVFGAFKFGLRKIAFAKTPWNNKVMVQKVMPAESAISRSAVMSQIA